MRGDNCFVAGTPVVLYVARKALLHQVQLTSAREDNDPGLTPAVVREQADLDRGDEPAWLAGLAAAAGTGLVWAGRPRWRRRHESAPLGPTPAALGRSTACWAAA